MLSRLRLSGLCSNCRKSGFHFIEIDMKSSDRRYLNEEQTKRVRQAVEKVISIVAGVGCKWNFVLRFDWPKTEEEVIHLEARVWNFRTDLAAAIMEAAIKKAESDARNREQLGNFFEQLSLSSGAQAAEGQGGSGTSLQIEVPEDELVAELEKLMLTS
jgi:hypothetical protein